MLTALLLALGLSMDAVAVSICAGMAAPDAPLRRSLRMPLAFGAFQAAMPLLGWLGGAAFQSHIATWDHWLACGLLTAIGAKMLWEARADDADGSGEDPFAWGRLGVLALATSIDALAAGLTIAVVDLPPALTIAVIGIVTALLCVPAVLLGSRLGRRWATGAEVAGGVVLIAIGAKIVAEHLAAARG